MIDKIVTVKKEGDLVAYGFEYAKNCKSEFGEKALSFGLFTDSLRKLIGRTLTIIDASTSGAQNKAMKDLVRNAFSEEIGFVSDLVFDTKKLQAEADKIAQDIPLEDLEKHTVSVEEMLGV